jgi:cytidylate kinase (EC 2.7.4.14)
MAPIAADRGARQQTGTVGVGEGSGEVGLPDQPLIITIDGPAGTGKSTVARLLAKRLGLDFSTPARCTGRPLRSCWISRSSARTRGGW